MNGKRWGILAVLATVLANAGCVSCCHKSYEQALESGAECSLPTPCRNQVHVFLIHGVTPTTDCGLNTLRAKLAENGFAKVGIAELAGGFCVEHEIKKIRACEPEAKFVLVGYDFGAAAALAIARDLDAKHGSVEAVVLLDPVGCGKPTGSRTLLVTSGTTTSTVAHSERMAVSDANHFNLPAHPSTVAAITGLLRELAVCDWQAPGDPVPAWSYAHAPEMRPASTGRWGEEWDFLADRPGTASAIGTRTIIRPVETPVPIATSAGPVVLRK